MLEKNFEEIKNSISSLNTNINNSNNNSNNNHIFESVNVQMIPQGNIVGNERKGYHDQNE